MPPRAQQSLSVPTVADWLVGGGEMGRLIASIDWSTTPLGPRCAWPGTLRTALGICLASRHPVVIWWGRDCLMLYNDAFRPILGEGEDPHFLGRPGKECWPDLWHLIGPLVDRVFNGEGVPLPEELVPKVPFFDLSLSPIRDEGGQAAGIFAFCSDPARDLDERHQKLRRDRDHLYTLLREQAAELELRNAQRAAEAAERGRAEEELLRSEERYRSIIEHQSVYVCRYLPGGLLTYVNDSLARMHGVTPRELIGRSFYPYVYPDDLPEVIRTIESLSAEHPGAVAEIRVTLPSGVRWHRWDYRALFDGAGNVVEYQSVGWDVTEKRLAEEALFESERRYRAVVEDQTETICRFLPDGTFTFVNDVYCRIIGKSQEELVGQKWLPVAFPDDLPLVEEGLRGMSAEHPVAVIENRVRLANGEVRWMQFVNRGFYDENGRLVETQAVGRDVTDRRRAEEATRSYARRLLELDEELRREMASELHDGIGHQLAVLGMDLSMMIKYPADEMLERYQLTLDTIREKVAGVNRAVRGLMSRLRPPVLEDFGLVSAMRWYGDIVADQAGLVVETSLKDVARLSAETELMLYRIFQEALHNVVKHAGATRVRAVVRKSKGRLVLTVKDNGAGFNAAEARRGQGISHWGLTIMRERAESIGAALYIDTAPGKGTTVRVELKESGRCR